MARICLLGGGGFIGRSVAEALVERAHAVIIPTRRREWTKRNLLMLPTVEVVDADIHDDATLDRLFAGCDAVINLVGVLHSKPGQPYGREFERVHVALAKRIVAACEKSGVRRLLHMSALGAAADAPSEYLRSKAAGAAMKDTAADNV